MNRLLLLIAALLFAGNTLPYTASADAPFAKVVPGRVLSYPKDHGAHPEFKTEWWYFTGHLSPKGEAKPRFGFELVFFRTGLSPQPVTSPSAWRVSSLYFYFKSKEEIEEEIMEIIEEIIFEEDK